MLSYFTWLLQRARATGQAFFLRFGLHCATHQIRVILISCVVITSLFYPALALYSSSQSKSLSIIDSFVPPNIATEHNDLVNLWSPHKTLNLYEDAVSRAKCGVNRALRVERILIQSPLVEDDDGALNRRILLSTLQLEKKLEAPSLSDSCLRKANGSCLMLSPLLFWDHDAEALRSDPNILDTLSLHKNITISGVPVTPAMVLAGRGSSEHVSAHKFDFAMFLALTYFFPQSDCIGNVAHSAWLQAVQSAAGSHAVFSFQDKEPDLIALEYNPNMSKRDGWSAISVFLYMAYIGFFAYVTWSMRHMDKVHSRVGVTFTALVEIAVSTITSLSVCALVGFKVTMVPWELLPIVIVFVGAENMFNLVHAVGRTQVTLSVKQRIAEGLSYAGTSNTLKVVSYNCILGVIAASTMGAIHQFCVFAIVVLIAHWFLAHTFFIAVLSIDIQRLELDELFRQDSGLAPLIPKVGQPETKKPKSGWRKLVTTAQNLLKSRATTNLSLLMLLAITATLYYTTYTTSTSTTTKFSNTSFGAVSRPRTNFTHTGLGQKPPALQLWDMLNPNQSQLLHVRLETPTIITLDLENNDTTIPIDHKSHRPRFSMRTLRLVFWFIKIMVLPIGFTTTALWILCLYLLKDAELLEAQKHRSDLGVSEGGQNLQPLQGKISFSPLPRTLASDVEFLAVSKDGQTIVSIGLHNEIVVWRSATQTHISIDIADILLRMPSNSPATSTLTSAAIDDSGRHCAVGTGAGVIATWRLEGDVAYALPPLSLPQSSGAVTDIQFIPTLPSKNPERTPPQSEPSSPIRDREFVDKSALVAAYETGLIVKWNLTGVASAISFTPSRRTSVVKSSLINVVQDNRMLIAFCLDDGTLELVDPQDDEPLIMANFSIQPGNPVDAVSKVHVCRTVLNGAKRSIIAVATEVGSISLWDGMTGECITTFDELYGRVSRIRVAPVLCETCRFCGQLPLESVSITFSVEHLVRFFKLYLNDQLRRCSCTQNQPRNMSAASRESLDRRSRSNSNANSPSIPRARLGSSFDTSPFPVSAHGVHSRRASEKETGRRSLETLTVPFANANEEYDSSSPGGSEQGSTGGASFWKKAMLTYVTETTSDRGGWDVCNKHLVGVRRKPRAQGMTKSGTASVAGGIANHRGLTAATLERWELWTFDPSTIEIQSSLLASLVKKQEVDGEPAASRPSSSTSSSTSSSSNSSSPSPLLPRLPFTRVSPLLTTSSHALAGFGNTIGIFSFSNS